MSDSDTQPVSKTAKKTFDIAVLFAVCGILFSLLIFLFMLKQERESVLQQFNAEMSTKVADFQHRFTNNLEKLNLLQASFVVSSQSNGILDQQVSTVLNNNPVFNAVVWFAADDSKSHWILSQGGYKLPEALKSQTEALATAGLKYQVFNHDGNRSLIYKTPQVEQGMLVSLLNIERLVSESQLGAVDKGISFKLLGANGEVIHSLEAGVVVEDSISAQKLQGQVSWDVSFAATEDYLSAKMSYMPALFLLMGLLLSFLVASYLKKLTRNLAELREEQETLSQQVVDATWSDPSTGLANRVHFDETLDIECRRAIREFAPLTLLIAEIDHYSEYISCYGEQGADVTLQKVAQTLAACVTRPGDLLARTDSHQFAFILPSTNEMATYLAARCCESVETQKIPHDESSVASVVTISIGLVTLQPSKYLTPERLYEAAFEQLLQAQNNGGNQYIAFAEQGLEPSVTYSV